MLGSMFGAVEELKICYCQFCIAWLFGKNERDARGINPPTPVGAYSDAPSEEGSLPTCSFRYPKQTS